jgi:hypothetical protein
LLQTGHIKLSNLNKKKIVYIVTPKGIFEKANHSYAYLSRTLKVFLEYQRRLTTIIQQQVDLGVTSFAVSGNGEIPELVEIALRGFSTPLDFRRISNGDALKDNEVLLDCRFNIRGENQGGVNILAALLNGKADYD